MQQCTLGRYSFGRVKSYQLTQQIQTIFIKVLKLLLKRLGSKFREGSLEISQFGDSRPIVIRRSSIELEDLKDLSNFTISCKKWSFLNDFTENATNGPHIYSQ
jgi:hypothetical protein